MSKYILVPTDFSKGAEHALEYAIALARKEKASIIMLHAFHPTYMPPDSVSVKIKDKEAVAEKRSKDILTALSSGIVKTKNIKCEIMSRPGLAVDVILEAIKEKKPQMVIMGTKGATGMKEVIVGSNTAKILEYARCPVIAVPENSAFKGINKITYATDYLGSDVTALKKLVEIAKPFQAEINVLHVSDEEFTQDTDKELLNKFKVLALKKLNYNKVRFQLEYGSNIEKALQEHLKQEQPDILAMSTHYRGIIDKIFGKSVAKKMAYHSQVPVLVFHHKHQSVTFI